jgi:SH3-like domain-containing protein
LAWLAAVSALPLARAYAQASEPASQPSGLAVPRFVSLKSDRVNLRSGPGTEYPTTWVFRRAGMPVEIIKEFEAWRQVRDAEGATGWVLQTMLSGRRTALVMPWEAKPGQAPVEVALKVDDRESSRSVAMVEAGVIASVRGCDKRWCSVVIGDYKGYLEQNKLWGVYPGEFVK